MENQNNVCSVCSGNIRNPIYSFHYLGQVCSMCWRMSKSKYVNIVNNLAPQNVLAIDKYLLSINKNGQDNETKKLV
jgi:hypothetical protein